jgi:hypothetical protein
MEKQKSKAEELPITFLNAETAAVKMVDQPQEYAMEQDTFNDASGDSDTN